MVVLSNSPLSKLYWLDVGEPSSLNRNCGVKQVEGLEFFDVADHRSPVNAEFFSNRLIGGETFPGLLIQVAFDRNIDSKAVYADLSGQIINNGVVYPGMWRNGVMVAIVRPLPLHERAIPCILLFGLAPLVLVTPQSTRFCRSRFEAFLFPALLYPTPQDLTRNLTIPVWPASIFRLPLRLLRLVSPGAP